VAGKDRERRLARERYERQQARRAEARHRARRRNAVVSAALAVVLVVGGVTYLASALGGGGQDATTQAASTPSAGASASPSATPTQPAGTCAYRKASGGKTKDVGSPPTKPPTTGPLTATLSTNRGPVRLSLDAAKAPCTVNSFRYLASKHYFDGSPCHRLTTKGIFVLQCGDPFGTGRGGPGYEFDEENLPSAGGVTYPKGTVAMARTSQPGTNGSQFFLVYKDTTLPADYTIFGRVTGGMDVLTKVAKAGTTGTNGDGPPKRKVVVRKVQVTEQKA